MCVLDFFSSVLVLIRWRHLGAGECLPGLLMGDCVEWGRFDREVCSVVTSISEAGVCGWHTGLTYVYMVT